MAEEGPAETGLVPEFPELPPLESPPAPPAADGWVLPAGALLILLASAVAWGTSRLRRDQRRPLDPLDQARLQLERLRDTNPGPAVAARGSTRILCDAWCQRYRETLLAQPGSLVLQRRAFLRQLPTSLREPLLLFLADCLESAYRPDPETRPARQILDDAERLLDASRGVAPPR